MKITAFPIRLLARYFLRQEWQLLSVALGDSYASYATKSHLSPVLLYKLLISGEDHRFFSHGGFDVVAIARAVWRNLVFNKREGASTIEQQIVRVLTGNFERTLRRKVKEIFLATLVGNVVPKQDLPGLYLDIAYYGWRMNGLRQACSRLRLDLRRLSLGESASLVARLKYPEPKQAPPDRIMQIKRRSVHLTNLYRKHSLTGVYSGIQDNATIYLVKAGTATEARFSSAI
jgi:membrane peptidoglycan carboxypeptidase